MSICIFTILKLTLGFINSSCLFVSLILQFLSANSLQFLSAFMGRNKCSALYKSQRLYYLVPYYTWNQFSNKNGTKVNTDVIQTYQRILYFCYWHRNTHTHKNRWINLVSCSVFCCISFVDHIIESQCYRCYLN